MHHLVVAVSDITFIFHTCRQNRWEWSKAVFLHAAPDSAKDLKKLNRICNFSFSSSRKQIKYFTSASLENFEEKYTQVYDNDNIFCSTISTDTGKQQLDVWIAFSTKSYQEESNLYSFKISEMFFSLVNKTTHPDKSIQNAPPTIYQFVQCSRKQKQFKSFKIMWVPNVCCKYFEKLKWELL